MDSVGAGAAEYPTALGGVILFRRPLLGNAPFGGRYT